MTHEIKNPEKPTYFVAYSEGISHVGVALPYETTTTGQPNFYYSTDPQEFLKQTKDIEMPDLAELPEDAQAASAALDVGDIYWNTFYGKLRIVEELTPGLPGTPS